MATRKIKDAKDLSTGELVYFRGHAQVTHMSDGRTVEQAIDDIQQAGSVTEDYVNEAIANAITTTLNTEV